jgi:decaprenylphospho-beta-D-erythro-pentofuranosid-2-ulose 2-reductase
MSSVLILGATSDMAMAIAEKFASEKFDIFLACRNHNRLDPFCKDLRIRFQVNCALFEFDATDTDCHQFFVDSINPFPEITICVFGYLGDQKNAEINWFESAKIINTNYLSAVSILNLIAQYYESQKTGSIIGISSVAGERGRQSNFIYGSAKAGFTAYLSGLRNRMYHHGVHVMTVKPGFVQTKMTENLHLPSILTATPKDVAKDIYKGFINNKNTIYTLWFWKWIICIIKMIPDFLFKKMKL